MKKHSSSYYHRILLMGALLAGASLLVLNAWMVSSSDADLVLPPWWSK
jgi:hypothetical protein